MPDLLNCDPPKVLKIKVTTKARFQKIKKEFLSDGSEAYKVYVTAAAEDGKANEAVLKLLAKTLGVAKSDLVITHGLTSREKTVKINFDKKG